MRLLSFSAQRGLPRESAMLSALAQQRGRLFLAAPVALSIGIGLYFLLPREPVAAEWLALAALGLFCAFVVRFMPDESAPLGLALALVVLGCLVAGLRSAQVAAPVLGQRYYGPIEGRVVKIDRAPTDSLRLTLDDVVLQGLSLSRTPARVRVTLNAGQNIAPPEPGLRVMTTGHLGPPPAPAEPGGFDFRRVAWFERLGAVGYTRAPVLVAAPAEAGAAGLRMHRLRMAISAHVQAHLPGDSGGFAAAILTGDRSGISQLRMEELRRSNLAHLLAISGLHMGLLTGFVFGLLRLLMALVPPVALRAPTRKIAALGALGAGAFYLALSGGNVATERAFIMVSVMLAAVVLERRAISLRSVALAAMVILLIRPEALVQAGFQMSFAATVALVAVFRWLADEQAWRGQIPRWLWPAISLVICSVVAGVATAPVAAASFNRLAEYGLIANLLAVPLMGTVIMPAAVLAALLAPFGMQGLGLAIMGPAIDWILAVSAYVSAMEGAVISIRQPMPAVMPLLSLGALWLIIWNGRARLAGVPVIALGLILWAQTDRPALLIAPEAQVVGLMLEGERIISRARTGSFIAESWLRSDGDGASQPQAHARSGYDARANIVHLRGGGFDVVHLWGEQAAAQLEAVCLPGRIVVLSISLPAITRDVTPCDIITPREMRATGARAYVARGGKVQMRSATASAGARPWTHP